MILPRTRVRHAHRAATVAALLVLGSCALLTEPAQEGAPAPPPELPERFLAEPLESGATDARTPFWESFGDPELSDLVRAALDDNRGLAAVRQTLLAARARARIAGAAELPTLDASLDASRARQAFVGLPIPGSDGVLATTATSFGWAIGASWEPDLWGRLDAREEAAVFELAATEEDLRAARLALAGACAKAVFAVRGLDARIALAEETLAQRELARASVARRLESGRASAVELSLVDTERHQLEAELADLRARREAATRQLETLVGEPPRGAGPDSAPLPEVPERTRTDTPAAWLARRPDLVASARRVQALEADHRGALRDLYPRLSLQASFGGRSDALEDLFDPDLRTWSLAAGLVQPLFDGGRLRAAADLADARARAAVEDFANRLLEAWAEVETLLASEAWLTEREAALSLAAERALAAEALADDRYRRGLGDLLERLEATERALRARSARIDARRARLDLRVDLHLALGGEFEQHESEPHEDLLP